MVNKVDHLRVKESCLYELLRGNWFITSLLPKTSQERIGPKNTFHFISDLLHCVHESNCLSCVLQGQSDLLRGAKMDTLDALRQLALACEACGLTSSSNSSSSNFSTAELHYSSQPLSGCRSDAGCHRWEGSDRVMTEDNRVEETWEPDRQRKKGVNSTSVDGELSISLSLYLVK